MGILDSVERGLERAVNSAFARTFRSGVQPVEIAAGLKRELDIGAVVVDRDRVLAPNRFVVRLAPNDATRLARMGDTLERELIDVVHAHVRRQGYQLLGDVDVELRTDDSLATGVLEIDASQVQSTVNWVPIIEVDGVQHALRTGTSTVGRGSDADIRIGDAAASRQHLQLVWDGTAGVARDLGSTNGSKINGQRFREAALSPNTVITIGQTALRFQLVPARQQHTAAASAAASRGAFAPAAKPGTERPAGPLGGQAGGRPSAPPAAAPPPPGTPTIDQDFWRGL